MPPWTTCPRCDGTGVYNFGKCSLCDGCGRLNDEGEPYGKIAYPAPKPCGECVISVIAGASWIACTLPKGHQGGHRGKGNCFKHGEYLGAEGMFPQCPKWPECVAAPEPRESEARCAKCGHVHNTVCTHGIFPGVYCYCGVSPAPSGEAKPQDGFCVKHNELSSYKEVVECNDCNPSA